MIDVTNLGTRVKKICSAETDMNLWGALPDHENRTTFDGTLPQGLFRDTVAEFFF